MDPFSIITGLASSIINKIWPDKTEADKQKFLLEFQQELSTTQLNLAQVSVNQAEASNSNVWVSGARPFILWVCGFSFAWQFVLAPFITYFVVLFGHPIPILPVLDTQSLNTVLFGMLGLGAMRSYDKRQK